MRTSASLRIHTSLGNRSRPKIFETVKIKRIIYMYFTSIRIKQFIILLKLKAGSPMDRIVSSEWQLADKNEHSALIDDMFLDGLCMTIDMTGS